MQIDQKSFSRVDEWTEKGREVLSSTSSRVSSQQERHKVTFENLIDRCNTLVEEDIVSYVPTGNSPSKKKYSYNSTIPSTSSEDVILQEFRGVTEPIQMNVEATVQDEAQQTDSSAESIPEKSDSAAEPIHESSPEEPTLKETESVPEDDPAVAVDTENNASVSNQTFIETFGKRSFLRTRSQESRSSDSSKEHVLSRTKSDEYSAAEVVYLSAESIDSMKVRELRKELAARNCPQFGTKSILQQRLRDYIRKNQA